jgi:hypothetical protein
VYYGAKTAVISRFISQYGIKERDNVFTIQDLEKEKTTEANLLQYLVGKIHSFKQSREYRLAMDYTTYYDGENIDINRYEKVIYDTMGKAHVDM